MKVLVLNFLFLFIAIFASSAQYKIVKIKSDSIYVRFFYKVKQSRHVKNDSTYYICRTINDTSFILDKYVNNDSKIWSNIYNTIVARDSLVIYNKIRIAGGKSKIIKLKEKYYLGIIESNIQGNISN